MRVGEIWRTKREVAKIENEWYADLSGERPQEVTDEQLGHYKILEIKNNDRVVYISTDNREVEEGEDFEDDRENFLKDHEKVYDENW